MTQLQHAALGIVPFSAERIESLYAGQSRPTGDRSISVSQLCESHERMRAELEGTDLLLRESEQAVERMRAACRSVQCSCTVAERDSGHLAGCWMPGMLAAVFGCKVDDCEDKAIDALIVAAHRLDDDDREEIQPGDHRYYRTPGEGGPG